MFGGLRAKSSKGRASEAAQEVQDSPAMRLGENEVEEDTPEQDFVEKNVNSSVGLSDDELSTGLFASVIAIVEDRRQLSAQLAEHRRQIELMARQMEDLKQEKRAAQLRIEKKEEEIEKLQRQNAEKQLQYDQLVEDYKQLRVNDTKEREKLQKQIKDMRLQQDNLSADYSRYRAASTKEVERLEADVRDSLLRYNQLLTEYNRVREDNANLLRSISDFTRRMSTIGTPTEFPGGVSVVPIRPSVAGADDESKS